MTQWHTKSDKKISGGKRNSLRRCTKKLAWKGGDFSSTKVVKEDEERDTVRGKGKKTEKVKQYKAKFANVVNPKTKKTAKAEILTVLENPANRHYTRGNIITKGAVLKIKIGSEEKKARVTSRPGQAGTIDAVLTE